MKPLTILLTAGLALGAAGPAAAGPKCGSPAACNLAGVNATKAKDYPKAMKLFMSACKRKHAAGCFNAGVVLYKGQAGVAKDLARAAAFFKKGCAAGDKDSCKGVKLVAQARKGSSSGGGVPGANLTVGSLTVNGLSVRSLSCRLASAGFMAAALVVGSLAKQKRALERCGKRGDAPRVSWSYAGGRAKSVKVRGAKKKVNSCVARAMKRVRAKLSGQCSAVILLGK